MQSCIKCGSSQGRFLCKCGARYCGVACQKGHWPDHKAECRQALFKMEMDKTVKRVVDGWDDSKYACFAHFSKADALAAGYNDDVARGGAPDVKLTSGGVMAYLAYDVVQPMINARLGLPNMLRHKEWLLSLPDTLPKTITSIMLNVPGSGVDRILQTYVPHFAEEGWVVFHFFDYEKAISVMGPLMDVS